jgi:hypothetical protein
MNILLLCFIVWIWIRQKTIIISNKSIDKKIISISPAGYYGFYTWGICAYIKEHYVTDDICFSGASAGSWIGLFMIMNKNSNNMIDLIMRNELYKNKNTGQILEQIKTNIVNNYITDDFDLHRLFIGVSTPMSTNIYTNFENIEDALNCCLASSHIPLITGPLLRRYKNTFVLDGGFSKQSYLNTKLHIHPNMWGQHPKLGINMFKRNLDIERLYESGYHDTSIHGKEILDTIFTPKNSLNIK